MGDGWVVRWGGWYTDVMKGKFGQSLEEEQFVFPHVELGATHCCQKRE